MHLNSMAEIPDKKKSMVEIHSLKLVNEIRRELHLTLFFEEKNMLWLLLHEAAKQRPQTNV